MSFNTVYDVIKHVAFQMSDCEPGNEFVRFTQEILIQYLNRAICTVSEYRPDLFSQNLQIFLQAGSCQQLPDNVEYLIGIDGVDSPESNSPTATMSDFDLQKAFPPSKCTSARRRCIIPGVTTNSMEDYTISSFSYNPNNPAVFYVTPDAPAGTDTTITIQAVLPAPCYTVNDAQENNSTVINFDCAAINPIINLMMAHAHELDREALQNFNWAKYYTELAWGELRNTYQQQAAFNSGWYLGQQGGGDTNARRR